MSADISFDINLSGVDSDDVKKKVSETVVETLRRECRVGGLLNDSPPPALISNETMNEAINGAVCRLESRFDTRLTKDFQTYDALITERIDEHDRRLTEELKQFTYESIVKALYQSQQPQQPRATGQEALFWKEIKNIFSEELPDSPRRLWNFIADWAQKQSVPGGAEIYQHGGNFIRKGY